jgi:hypothetical protein
MTYAVGPVVLTKMCVQAILKDTPPPFGPWDPESMLFGYNDVQGGFAESGSVRRPRQGRDNIPVKHPGEYRPHRPQHP